ncbi:MAG TPA: Ig-like domain-containing protein [Kofleriaceae bacterium]
MRHTLFALIALTVSAGACSDHPYDPNGPAIDPNAPKIHITSPDRGAIAGDVHSVTVTGTASDDTGVAKVTVNGVPATLSDDGSWTAIVAVVPGTNLLHAIATDDSDNEGKESRSVVAGPMSNLAMQVPNALTASLSAQTFDAIGRGAAGYIKTADLEAMISPSNPVIHAGDPNGPDCLYGEAAITSMTVGDVDVTLAPQVGGLYLDAELSTVKIGMHLQYAVSCLDGSRDITIAASHISVSGNMAVGLTATNDFDIHLDNPNVQLTGFDLQLGGVPGTIVDLLHIDTALGPVIGWATAKFVTPMLNTSLAGLNTTKTMTVLKSQVDISIKPSKLDFSSAGAIIELDTSIRAHGDSGKFVFVDNIVPAMDLSHGFSLAVADDAANQALASMWSAKGLDDTIMLNNGSYGDIGTLYDSVEIATKAPPFVDASNTANGLVLTIGDLMASFKSGAQTTTEAAINAQVGLKVSTGSDGTIKFDVGQPTVYVDVLDEGIEGANQLSNAQFEAVTSFALARVIAVGSASLGSIPLPSIGGVGVTDIAISPQTGYLVVAGDVQ